MTHPLLLSLHYDEQKIPSRSKVKYYFHSTTSFLLFLNICALHLVFFFSIYEFLILSLIFLHCHMSYMVFLIHNKISLGGSVRLSKVFWPGTCCVPYHFFLPTQQRLHMIRMMLYSFFCFILSFLCFFLFHLPLFLKRCCNHAYLFSNIFVFILIVCHNVYCFVAFFVLLSSTYKFFISLYFLWRN